MGDISHVLSARQPYGDPMTYTNPISLDLLMKERLCDRLHEAEQERLAFTARAAAKAARRSRPMAASAVVFTRILSWLV